MRIPAIGDILTIAENIPAFLDKPAVVVDVSLNGQMCVLARRIPGCNKVIESCHEVRDLKGKMTGTLVTPQTLKWRYRV